ncbi:MAG: enterobactin/ferric enterobactin esterase [Bacteroidetes bacterium ADurb.Bin408]|nr:MAG: enterobactin/ferric enterobactin esterase [Bacteroidetes bacterium ADurb.Bin408]
MPNRENTAIAGSSMGGLISLYSALKYPNTFSKAGIFSPSLWFSDTLQMFLDSFTYNLPQRFYFVAGLNESTTMVSDIQDVTNKLILQGFPAANLNTVIKTDGEHSEWFWKREFPDAFIWLFQVVTGVNSEIITDTPLYYNTETSLLTVEGIDSIWLSIYDLTGRLVFSTNKTSLNLSFCESGFYIVHLKTATQHDVVRKIYVY